MFIIAGSFTFLLMGPLLMDHRRFRDDAPGTLRAIETHGGWSFIPDPLPPTREFPSSLWPFETCYERLE